MNCKSANDYMMRYFDGNLDADRNAKLKQHLGSCEACREEFNQLNEIFSFLEKDDTVEPSEDFESAVMEKIEQLGPVYKAKGKKVSIYNVFVYILIALSGIFITSFEGFNTFEVVTGIKGFDFLKDSFINLKGLYAFSYTFVSDFMSVLMQVGVGLAHSYHLYLVLGVIINVLGIMILIDSKSGKNNLKTEFK